MSTGRAHWSADEAIAKRVIDRVAGASFLGNFIEWFDYASYSFLATVMAQVFFPMSNEHTALLETFAVFALSFVMRPVGAVLWGMWGDRHGRRGALAMSILLMSGASFFIGCLPPAHVAGWWAALGLLVLRMVQGFSASGEYAGAATFLAEYAPKEHRGLYVSLVPASTAAGLLAGSLSAAALHAFLSDAALLSWGWRLPFLAAGPLGILTHYLRNHLQDSPVYTEMTAAMHARHVQPEQPLRCLWREHRRSVMIALGVASLNAVAFYLVLTYLPTYATAELGLSEGVAFGSSMATLTVYTVGIFGMGWLSDHVGRRRMLLLACVLFILLAIPAFWMMTKGGLLTMCLGGGLLALILTMNDGTLASYLVENYPTSVRYTGFALTMNVANAVFGGTAAFIATWLVHVTREPLAPAAYLVVIAICAAAAMLMSREHSGVDLREI